MKEIDIKQESTRIIKEILTQGYFMLNGEIREVSDAQIISLAKKFVDEEDKDKVGLDTELLAPLDFEGLFTTVVDIKEKKDEL